MSEKILVAVAWPYCNGDLHVGHIAGAYLPADIFARYHRLRGNDVLMVSGSDTHGTPITVRAEQEGITPRQVVDYYHPRFIEDWRKLGISFDIFTETDTENHWRITQEFFLRLLEKGYLYRATMEALFCPQCRRSLPDRYVEGTCPHCGYDGARGDQCERCGRTLDAIELIEPRCRLCGAQPQVRQTEHFFLDLARFNQPLLQWVEKQTHWRPNVLNFTLNILRSGELRGRPITRDIEWGIPVPVEGFQDKRIYVWFDAVIGYFAGSIEWAQLVGHEDKWREWWQGEARSFYFIGKDNIPFHTIIWPAMLMGYGDLNLPYDVPANEYLNLEGRKLSTSRNWAVWVPDYLSRYDPDPLRYYLTIVAPEGKDTDFSWGDFLRRNNDELLATWGNLVHRVLTFVQRHFQGQVPEPDSLSPTDQAILASTEETFAREGRLLETCKLKAALGEAMALAHEANRYLDEQAPWFQIKEDRRAAATTIYVTLRVIDSLKILLCPFLPFSCQKLHRMLGYQGDLLGRQYVETVKEEHKSHLVLRYDGSALEGRWEPSRLPPGQVLGQVEPLFKKLEESIVAEEMARLGR